MASRADIMSQTHDIEAVGVTALTSHLRSVGRIVSPSDTKTVDLVVDGVYAEVKSKVCPYRELDFIGLTDNQFRALQDGKQFVLFMCNLENPSNAEIIEIP